MKQKKKWHYILCIFLTAVLVLTPLLTKITAAVEEQTEETQESNIEETEETEEIEKNGTLSGLITVPEEIDPSKIKVLVYDAEQYDQDASEHDREKNIPVAEVMVDEAGKYEIGELIPGMYCLEFLSYQEDFDAAAWELLPEEDEETYTLSYVEEEAYFIFGRLALEEMEACEVNICLQKRAEEETVPDTETSSPETETPSPETGELSIESEEPSSEDEADTTDELMMSIDELENLPMDVAGATFIRGSAGVRSGRQARMVTGSDWTFDVYYVGESDKYYTEKQQDFPLKYQMVFHNSTDLEENSVEIRISLELMEDRNGNMILPDEIAVPRGTYEEPVASKYSPFNYYIDEDTNEIVFFNYRKIDSGSNVAFQTIFKKIKLMDIVDETSWELKTNIKVDVRGEVEERELTPLTGKVDSAARLNTVTKKPYNNSGKAYTPGLYRRSQVLEYINGPLPTEYDEHFEDYVYMVWEVQTTGNATQPWNMFFKDTPGGSGQIVGYQTNSAEITEGEYEGYREYRNKSSSSSINESFRVVVAYPRDEVDEDTALTNSVDVVLQPYDGIDPDQKRSANGVWSYKDYIWIYEGDELEITKSAKPSEYRGWLDSYKARAARGEDKGDITYTTKMFARGFSLTHYTSGENMGEKIEGTSYRVRTMDDVLYAHSSNDAANPLMINYEDYYFSAVDITQIDREYDVWQDKYVMPQDAGDLIISAMFANSADSAPNEWEEVGRVEWSESGFIRYKFSDEDLAKQPWRVMVERETTNYSTTCNIDVAVRIRHDSPVFTEILEGNPDSVYLQNLSGVFAQKLKDGTAQSGIYSDIDFNYDQYSDLEDVTKGLYDTLIPRDCAMATLTGLKPRASSYKAASAANDPQNGRVNLKYTLTAYDGYQVDSQETLEEILENSNIPSPGRGEVVFYDLLPYGVRFDPSVAVSAGRTTNMSGSIYQTSPQLWDSSQVSVTVDTKNDIINNYRNTGRTMIQFHLTYEGDDSAFYSSNMKMWLEGWGVSFGAYYEWKDADIVKKVPNISAFMPADDAPLIGAEGEVMQDDGVVPVGLEENYKAFIDGDLDGDGNKTEKNVLYAHALAYEDGALASESSLSKLVRADADRFGIFDTSTAVENGKGYTYEIRISNAKGTLKDLVIFDNLENAAKDRDESEKMEFESDWWYGTFAGVRTETLTVLGIAPVIYYHGNRDEVLIPKLKQTPDEILKESNGWYTAERWTELGYELDKVQAVAVDIRKTKNGDDFELQTMASIGFQIQMTAPDGAVPTYAYNNPSFYSYEIGMADGENVIGNSVKVKLADVKDLTVEKEFGENTPENVTDTKFEFTVFREEDGEKKGIANLEYELFRLNEESQWKQVSGIYAADAAGRFYIRAGEKAVFRNLADADNVIVEETENPYWHQEFAKTTEGGGIQYLFTNTFRPVLYAQKKVENVPADVDISADIFTFQLWANDEPVANAEYWYVDSIRTDGGVPSKVLTKGKNGVGKTDGEGKFKLQAGDIVALFPGVLNTNYTLKEVGGAGESDNWFCKVDEVKGTIPVLGASATITNYYRWKDLYLTKKVINRKDEVCDDPFTFCITDETGAAVTGNEWILIKDGKDDSGTLNDKGEFTCACAGGVVRIKGLEAGKTYYIKETNSGDLYEALDGGLVEVTMPQYGLKANAEITNDYLVRPLAISKVLLFDDTDPQQVEDAKNKPFTMTITVDGKLLKNEPYILYQNGAVVEGDYATSDTGSLSLKNGQTAVLEEAGIKGDSFVVAESDRGGYQQLYPAQGDDHKGNLDKEENNVTFINGEGSGKLLLRKEYTAEDEAGKEAVKAMQEDAELRAQSAVNLTLEVSTEGGERRKWPETTQEVTIVDELDASVEKVSWEAGSSIVVEPWKTISLDNLDENLQYRLYESQNDQQRMLKWQDGVWIEISQKTPSANQAVTGVVAEDPLAVIVNQVRVAEPQGSQIYKEMRLGAETVPTGAELIWRLEEYNGSVWNPKKGVEYLVFDDAGLASEQIMVTEDNGLLTLVKTDQGYPSVKFINASVKINFTTGMRPGSLRLVEVLTESHEDWGYLSGYVDQQGGYGVDTPSDDAVAFLNSNASDVIEIAKTMDEESNDSFTIILEQVIEAGKYPVTEKDQILSVSSRGGIAYTIHDSKTGEMIGESATTAKGEIIIKAGQYVRIKLPDETLWTVREQVLRPYVLRDMSGNPENKFTKLDDNLMLIQPKAEREVTPITLTKEMVENGVRLASTGRWMDLTQGDVVIPERIIVDGQERVITEIERAGSDTTGVFEGRTEITSVVIPDTVTLVGDSAFYGCTNLKEITIPDGVTSIGESVFGNCSNLTEVTLPKGLTEIAASLFYGCTKLNGIEIPSGVTSIGDWAFQKCSSLSGTVTIPAGVTAIGYSVFSQCTNLNKVESLGTITSIGSFAFDQCISLTATVSLENVTSIGNNAFKDCAQLDGVTLSDNLKSIGTYAFYGCSSMSGELKIAAGVTTIYEQTFYGCSSVSAIKFANGVRTIDNKAFYGCSSAEVIVLSNKLTAIRSEAFSGCESVKEITIPANVSDIKDSAFSGCSSLETVDILRTSSLSIGNNVFLKCSKLKQINLPNSVTSIGTAAFQECSSLTAITIPSGINTLSTNLFNKCTSLQSVVVPDNVKSMGTSVFEGCESLASVELPSMSYITRSTFKDCKNLTSVEIPSGVTRIYSSAFVNCSSLAEIKIPATTQTIDSGVFTGCTNLTLIEINRVEGGITGIPWGAPNGNDIVQWTGTE